MDTAERVRRTVEEHGPLTVPQIAKRLGLHRRRIYHHVHTLRRKGRIHVTRQGQRLVAASRPVSKTAAAQAALRAPLAELHAWLSHHPGLDQASITRHWQQRGWKRSTIQHRLHRLEAAGLAHRSHKRRGATWHAHSYRDAP